MGGKQVDLNELRTTILRAQSRGEIVPSDPSKRILVNREGEILVGESTAGDSTQLSVVPQDVFARDVGQ